MMMRFAWQIAVDFARKLQRHLPVNSTGEEVLGQCIEARNHDFLCLLLQNPAKKDFHAIAFKS